MKVKASDYGMVKIKVKKPKLPPFNKPALEIALNAIQDQITRKTEEGFWRNSVYYHTGVMPRPKVKRKPKPHPWWKFWR